MDNTMKIAPSKTLLELFKEKQINERKYEDYYKTEILGKLDSQQYLDEIIDITGG